MTGWKGSLGIGAETTFGTYAPPTRFHEFNSESLAKVKNTVQGGGIAAGRYGRLGSRRVLTTEGAAGSFALEVANQKMGLLFSHALGSSAAPVQQGATTAYLQTHTVSDNVGKSLSIQKGVPDASGTVRPYTFKGCKITAIEFSCEVSGMLQCSVEVDGRQVSEVETLAAASLPTGLAPFHFGQMSVKVGASGSEQSVSGVRGMSLRIARPQNTERYYAGANGLKAEQLSNDFPTVTGSFSTDFLDKTVFADRYASHGSASLVWEFIGPTIAGAFPQTFRVKVPLFFLNEGTPAVGGPDIVAPSFGFEGLLDAAGNPLATIEFVTTDTTL